MGADRDRRCGSKYERRTEAMSRPDNIPRQRILQLPDGIRWAARAHKNHVRIKKRFDNLRVIRAKRRVLFAGGDRIYDRLIVLQTSLHKIAYTSHDLSRIQFETCWCFHQCD